MYCTLDDLKKQVREEVLVALTDDASTGAVDQTVVDKAIADASAEIDAYAQGRYPVPFSPVPQVIGKIAVDMSLYNLFSRRGFDPEGSQDKVISERYKSAVRFLENLAKGLVQIGAAQPQQVSEQPPVIQSSPRVFSREKMRPL
jgi:phage gp36-like protein